MRAQLVCWLPLHMSSRMRRVTKRRRNKSIGSRQSAVCMKEHQRKCTGEILNVVEKRMEVVQWKLFDMHAQDVLQLLQEIHAGAGGSCVGRRCLN